MISNTAQTLPQAITHSDWDGMIDGLVNRGWSITDQFIISEEAIQLKEYVDHLRREGQMKKAGIGKMQDFAIEEEIRGDFIHWVPQEVDLPILQNVLSRLTDFQSHLNRTCYLGLKTYETHLTSYPQGTFYKIHKDRFRHHAHRVISFVLYLNPDWDASKGGELVIYPEDSSPVSILPQAGRLAIFKSELNHEVKVCHAQRYSLTGWMLDTLPGTTFL